MVVAISNVEFATALRKLNLSRVPSNGRLGVAFSGGPDSLCLLFLLRRLANSSLWNQHVSPKAVDNPVVSFIVNHELQASSQSMTNAAVSLSSRLGVPSVVSTVPWGEAPFPSRPPAGANIESDARTARYHLLLQDMLRQDVQMLCTGHHLDDQIETGLMRLGTGSTRLGLAGMSPVRRWGMGSPKAYASGLGWAGSAGMDSWILRPLLEFHKSRILATCEEHGLEYITDSTNFQPALTRRNQIRHTLATRSHSPVGLDAVGRVDQSGLDGPTSTPLTEALPSQVLLGAGVAPLSPNGLDADSLKSWVDSNKAHVERCELEATEYFSSFSPPVPPSTIFLPEGQHISPDAQQVVILRALRYVSPNPWGSPAAESHRSTKSLNTIVSHIFPSTLQDAPSPPTAFSAGSGVLWTPVIRTAGGRLRPRRTGKAARTGGPDVHGWLAQRLPPPSTGRLSAHAGAVTFCENSPPGQDSGHRHRLYKSKDWVSCDGRTTLDFLFDCRFRVVLNLDRLGDGMADWDLGRVTHVSLGQWGPYSLPRIRLRDQKGVRFTWNCPATPVRWKDRIIYDAPWVRVEHIRELMELPYLTA